MPYENETRKPGLLEVLRRVLRLKHYSLRTEEAYTHWVRRFIAFHGRRHPRERGGPEVAAFLSHLANEGEVAASTQNQALSALLFLYREVLEIDLPWLGEVDRAKRPARLPVVLTRTARGRFRTARGAAAFSAGAPPFREGNVPDGAGVDPVARSEDPGKAGVCPILCGDEADAFPSPYSSLATSKQQTHQLIRRRVVR